MKVQYLLLEHVHSQILMILKKNYGQGKKKCALDRLQKGQNRIPFTSAFYVFKRIEQIITEIKCNRN